MLELGRIDVELDVVALIATVGAWVTALAAWFHARASRKILLRGSLPADKTQLPPQHPDDGS